MASTAEDSSYEEQTYSNEYINKLIEQDQRRKEYRQKTREKRNEYNKTYYEQNKQKMKEQIYKKQVEKRFFCEVCGKDMILKNKAYHLNSKIHNKRLNKTV